MTEKWREIEGWNGRFEVSDQGRVRFTKDNRILPQTQIKGGWLSVYLFHNAKRRWPRVHTLVADAFIANPMQLPCVSHKNGDRTDNRLENLECMLIGVDFDGEMFHLVPIDQEWYEDKDYWVHYKFVDKPRRKMFPNEPHIIADFIQPIYCDFSHVTTEMNGVKIKTYEPSIEE